MTHDDRLRESIARLDRDHGDPCGHVCTGLVASPTYCTRPSGHDGGHTDGTAWWHLSVATCPPDATETPADTSTGVDTAEDRTEGNETDAGGMDNQGAELDRLRAEVERLRGAQFFAITVDEAKGLAEDIGAGKGSLFVRWVEAERRVAWLRRRAQDLEDLSHIPRDVAFQRLKAAIDEECA